MSDAVSTAGGGVLQTELVSVALQQTLEAIMPGAVFPHVYTGPMKRYAVWNYEAIPTVWAEGVPQAAVYLVQAHLYLPHPENPHALILKLEKGLFDAGFTWPSLTDASDEDGQHWVLECEYADGGGYYGYV